MGRITSVSLRRLVTTAPYENIALELTAAVSAGELPGAVLYELRKQLATELATLLGPAAAHRTDDIRVAWKALTPAAQLAADTDDIPY